MRILPDSNAYSNYSRGNETIGEIMWAADEIFMSAIVIGELLAGYRGGTRFEINSAELRSFLANPNVSVVSVSAATADHYARISASLRAKGRPIPTNDIWIAAHAMETGADLVSADSHFENVDGLA